MPKPRHAIFWAAWWSCNLLLAAALSAFVYSGVRGFSVRRHLDGYSAAIVPSLVPLEQRVETILDCTRAEPSRASAAFFSTPEIKE